MTDKVIDGVVYNFVGSRKGPVIVLIHGLGLNKDMWQYQLADLQKNYCVLTYDLFGHGLSEISKEEPSLTMFTEQLNKLLNSLAISEVVLVGFSLGGMIARHFSQTYPKKVFALAILNSPHTRKTEAQDAVLKRYHQVSQLGPGSTVEDALNRWLTGPFVKDNQDKVNLVRSWVLANKHDIYSKNYLILVDGVKEVVGKIGRINCPTLVITGEEDYGNGPEMAKSIADEIQGAEVIILKGLRHMALFEDPIQMNKHLNNFLKKTLI